MTTTAKPPPSWKSTYAAVSTGVVRIDSVCTAPGAETVGTGTGFLIAPDLVATVAHVVEGGGALRVTSPTSGLSVAAEVIGLDHRDDLALVRTAAALPGHVFTIAAHTPAIGTEMAAIGFPLGQAMQLSIGHITGIHDHRRVGGGFDLSDVLLSDAALNPGNSGGPWITRSGKVIALTESGPPYDEQDQTPAQGNNGGVSAADALAHFDSWRSAPEPEAGRGCQPADATSAAAQTLDLYFYEIDLSDYASAYAQLDPRNHPFSGLTGFVHGVESSTDSAGDGSGEFYTVLRSGRAAGQVYLDVTFQSNQHAAQGPGGETCTVWTLRYEFSRYHGVELIHSTPAIPGSPGHRAC